MQCGYGQSRCYLKNVREYSSIKSVKTMALVWPFSNPHYRTLINNITISFSCRRSVQSPSAKEMQDISLAFYIESFIHVNVSAEGQMEKHTEMRTFQSHSSLLLLERK